MKKPTAKTTTARTLEIQELARAHGGLTQTEIVNQIVPTEELFGNVKSR